MNVLRRIKGVSRLEWKIRMEEMRMERTTIKIFKGEMEGNSKDLEELRPIYRLRWIDNFK